MNPKVVLSVAGTDSGGAAGLAADLATLAALEVHGACVVTAVTAQDTTGIRAVHRVPTAVVAAQLDAVLDDLPVSAAKTGLLGSAATVRLVAQRLDGFPLVVDPVLAASTGATLADEAVRRAYLDALLPVATIVTPNVSEARALLRAHDLQPPNLAEALSWLGPAALVTGGPDQGSPDELCTDWLALPGQCARALTHPRVPTDNDHGTGCTFSAALAVGLAHGDPLAKAAADAGEFTARQLRLSRTWSLGRGPGPIAHLSPFAFTKENP